jgi:hypothetical protein
MLNTKTMKILAKIVLTKTEFTGHCCYLATECTASRREGAYSLVKLSYYNIRQANILMNLNQICNPLVNPKLLSLLEIR